MKVETRTQVTLDLSTEEVAFLKLIAYHYKNTIDAHIGVGSDKVFSGLTDGEVEQDGAVVLALLACQRLLFALPWTTVSDLDFNFNKLFAPE